MREAKSTKTVPWGRGLHHPEPCGTEAAYRRHLRRKETPCDPCQAANRVGTRTSDEVARRRRDELQATAARLPARAGVDLGFLHVFGGCIGTDPDLFDLIGRDPLPHHGQAARENCARCPVIQECADYADRNGCVGVWAGSYRTGTVHGFRKLIDHAPDRRVP